MRSVMLTARKVSSGLADVAVATLATSGASVSVEETVILGVVLLVLAKLGKGELADLWFSILSKRLLRASDVLIFCV